MAPFAGSNEQHPDHQKLSGPTDHYRSPKMAIVNANRIRDKRSGAQGPNGRQ
jgi:hypothetical protein